MSTEATISDKIVKALSSNGALSNNKKVGFFCCSQWVVWAAAKRLRNEASFTF